MKKNKLTDIERFIKSASPDIKIYPFQRLILNIISTIPEGAEIKVDLNRQGTRLPVTYAVRDGIEFYFNGNEWKERV